MAAELQRSQVHSLWQPLCPHTAAVCNGKVPPKNPAPACSCIVRHHHSRSLLKSEAGNICGSSQNTAEPVIVSSPKHQPAVRKSYELLLNSFRL